ncbi:MAG: 4Fe-4S dicluster domain-containing protein [Anaerolineae bacterium]|nr:4Fe-4S dicluster domain-containing protein [Anaerolineae bacterium]
MKRLIPVESGDVLVAIRGFLKQLLETKVVDALLVPMETPAGTITPALVADPALLDVANPLAPAMGLNAARVVGKVSVREPRGHIGVVLRPCELRALVELVKLQQASLEDLVTIGVDCVGTYDVPVYLEKRLEIEDQRLWHELYGHLISNPQSPISNLRDACQMCEKPHAEVADITLELFGADLDVGIPVTLPDEVANTINLSPVEEDKQRAKAIEKIVATRTEVRDARFAEMQKRLDEEGIESVLAACVRCHNCMTVCPICYCKTCLFKSPTLDHEPMQYLNWARHKGAYRLPADTMLFHLTRLNHMVLSCVGCGMCTSNCPANLPVGRVFRTIGQQVQAAFDYAPGRSTDEPLPLVTFREDEWTEVGEE